jgi:hypothetical protein
MDDRSVCIANSNGCSSSGVDGFMSESQSNYAQYGGVILDTPIDAESETYWPAAIAAVEKASKHISKKLTEEQRWVEVERVLRAGAFAERCYLLSRGLKPEPLELEVETEPAKETDSLDYYLSDEFLRDKAILEQERDLSDE